MGGLCKRREGQLDQQESPVWATEPEQGEQELKDLWATTEDLTLVSYGSALLNITVH